jgi:very-short-patch-repair endonuclease
VTGEGFVPQTPSHRPTAKRIRNFAKNMRREPTDAEAAMWRLLRDRRLALFKFRRQIPFQAFILDFVCFERRIIIEIDGSQHASSERDLAREAVLMAEGFAIARYWNNATADFGAGGHSGKARRTVRYPSPVASLREAPPSPTRGEGEKDHLSFIHDPLAHPSP